MVTWTAAHAGALSPIQSDSAHLHLWASPFTPCLRSCPRPLPLPSTSLLDGKRQGEMLIALMGAAAFLVILLMPIWFTFNYPT